MKQKKLLDKLKTFFDADAREREKQQSDIKDILKKLKKRERKLKEKLEAEKKAEKRKHLQQEIDVIYVQRTKGIKLIKELNEPEKKPDETEEKLEETEEESKLSE